MTNSSFGQSEIKRLVDEARLRNLKTSSLTTAVISVTFLILVLGLVYLQMITQHEYWLYSVIVLTIADCLWVVFTIRKHHRISSVQLVLHFFLMGLASLVYTYDAFMHQSVGVAWMISLVFLPWAYPLPFPKSLLWIVPSVVSFYALIYYFFIHTNNDQLGFVSYTIAGGIFIPAAVFFNHEFYSSILRWATELHRNKTNLQFKNQVLSVLGHDLRNSLGSGYQLTEWLLSHWDDYDVAEKKNDLS